MRSQMRLRRQKAIFLHFVPRQSFVEEKMLKLVQVFVPKTIVQYLSLQDAESLAFATLCPLQSRVPRREHPCMVCILY